MADDEKNVIEITDHQHIHDMGIWMGVNRVFERLKAVPENKRAVGYLHALSLAEIELLEWRNVLLAKNMRLAAASGYDATDIQTIMSDGRKLFVQLISESETT